MKSFQSYFYESKKVYEFRIKIAQHDMDKPAVERLKSALEAFQLETISAPKRLPIQEHRDFPKMGPCECYVIDITVNYPTIAPQIRQLVAERAGITADCVCVYTKDEHDFVDEAEMRGQDHEGAYLNEPELEADAGGQEIAGQVRVGSLLKELESRKYEFAATEKTTGAMATDKEGVTSPVGTHQNKITSPVKGK